MTIVTGLSVSSMVLAFSIFGATAAAAEELHLHANLVGGHELAGGDADGTGTAAIQLRSSTQICVAIIVSKIATPTAAHIHQGFGSVNGPVVVPLTAPATGNPGGSFGCATIASALGQEIRRSPSNFYVNVHNDSFPGGALRGQLF